MSELDPRWPYCQATIECHEAMTRQYARTGTGSGDPWGVMITLSPTDDGALGIRLCRAHALLKFGVA